MSSTKPHIRRMPPHTFPGQESWLWGAYTGRYGRRPFAVSASYERLVATLQLREAERKARRLRKFLGR